MKTLEEEIAVIESKVRSLLDEIPIMWDEVNALERELLHLKKILYLSSEASATEDASVAIMESITKKV